MTSYGPDGPPSPNSSRMALQYAISPAIGSLNPKSAQCSPPAGAPAADETVKTVFVSTASSTKLRDTVQSVAAPSGACEQLTMS